MNAYDEKLMRSALRLAERGIGSVEPNPAVGCIIMRSTQVIGRGYHKRFGGPHAEINALEDCKEFGLKPEGGTMYVTLEPCCHQGKTGPCTKAIIDAGIKRVVVAVGDPSEHARGKGIRQLRRAGIEVEVGLCEEEAKRLNAPFFKYVTTGKCWVVLKWAQTLDGKLAYANPSPKRRWITGEASRSNAHRLRRRVGAILVGVNTVLADDPLLTPRPSKGKKPLRVVLDGSLRIPATCKLLQTAGISPVLVYTRPKSMRTHPDRVAPLVEKGAELLVGPHAGAGPSLKFLLEELARRGIAQVLVEGGPTVLTSFLKQGLADEVCVYISPQVLGPGGVASIDEAMAVLRRTVRLDRVRIKSFGQDVRISGAPNVSTSVRRRRKSARPPDDTGPAPSPGRSDERGLAGT